MTPASLSGLFNITLIIDKDESLIPVFALDSKALKPLALPSQLEAKCPF